MNFKKAKRVLKIKSFRFVFIYIILVSCVDLDSHNIPVISCDEPKISPSYTLSFLTETAKDQAVMIEKDLVIEAYTVSDDRLGNFFKTIYLVSEDNKNAIAIKADDYDLYATYGFGRKLYLKLKGLYYHREYGQTVVGALSSNASLVAIPKNQLSTHLLRSCELLDENQLIEKIDIKDINDSTLGKLIELVDVQFINEHIGQPLYSLQDDIGSATNRLIEDMYGYNLIIRTSKFADFSNYKIPSDSGNIKGVLTKYGNDYQLFAGSLEDISLQQDRFSLSHISIRALIEKEQDKVFTDDSYVEGIITLSGYADSKKINSRNLTESLAIMQDDTAAIALYFDDSKHELLEGDQVRVYLKGYNLDTYGGQFRLERLHFNDRSNSQKNKIQVISNSNPIPKPVEATLEKLIEGKYSLQIVKVKDVQISSEYMGLSFSGKKSFTDCKNQYTLTSRSQATFSKMPIPEGRGEIIGISNASKELLPINVHWADVMSRQRCDQAILFFEENFENVVSGDFFSQQGWDNISENEGDLLWQVNDFGGNKYLQASAYNQTDALKIWLITPEIDLKEKYESYLRFRTKDAYNNGKVLDVFVSTDYDGSNLLTANWTKLEAQISDNNFSGFGNTFIDSKKVDLSAYQEKVRIGFRYEGNPKGTTTTIQLDEIQLFAR